MRQEYGFGELYNNVISYIYTKLFFKNARLIRMPFYIRGKKNLKFGKGLTLGYGCRFEMYKSEQQGEIVVGENCRFGDYVHISSCHKVLIGSNNLLASKILIIDNSHGCYSGANQSKPHIPPNERHMTSSPVIIGNNIWIGENVCILQGVTIGDGSIIGAGAVVTNSIPPNSIAVGIPAKVIKKWNLQNNAWESI